MNYSLGRAGQSSLEKKRLWEGRGPFIIAFAFTALFFLSPLPSGWSHEKRHPATHRLWALPLNPWSLLCRVGGQWIQQDSAGCLPLFPEAPTLKAGLCSLHPPWLS